MLPGARRAGRARRAAVSTRVRDVAQRSGVTNTPSQPSPRRAARRRAASLRPPTTIGTGTRRRAASPRAPCTDEHLAVVVDGLAREERRAPRRGSRPCAARGCGGPRRRPRARADRRRRARPRTPADRVRAAPATTAGAPPSTGWRNGSRYTDGVHGQRREHGQRGRLHEPVVPVAVAEADVVADAQVVEPGGFGLLDERRAAARSPCSNAASGGRIADARTRVGHGRGSLGRPSTRSATMLRWISLAPP